MIFKDFIKSIRFKSLFDKKEPGDCERIFKLKFGGMEATKYLSFYAANQNWIEVKMSVPQKLQLDVVSVSKNLDKGNLKRQLTL